MEITINDALIQAVIVPIVIGLTEVAKHTGVPVRFLPILNIVFGAAIGFLIMDGSARGILIAGIIAGLAAGGFYRSTKVVLNNE